MNFDGRSYTRNRSRFPAHAPRQAWIPRGSSRPVLENPSTGPGIHSGNSMSGSRIHATGLNPGVRGESNVFMNPNHRRGRYRRKKATPEAMETSKERSSLPSLVQELKEKLERGTLECMICYDPVTRSAPIWSCSVCYSVFHLNCVKKWARSPTSIDLSAEENHGLNWRCPGCQDVQSVAFKDIQYACFCGKRTNPPFDLYLTPHSCGEPCEKRLEGGRDARAADPGKGDDGACPHVCLLQCHPGPCPPCKLFAPPCSCPCGKKSITRKCSERSSSSLSCGERCDKLLECTRHHCEQICHVGPCSPCQVPLVVSCFCRKESQAVQCGDVGVKGELEDVRQGVFSCATFCGKGLRCGNHFCREICHPGSCRDCELLPESLKSCCCGKTFPGETRSSCLDPVPTCSSTCGKLLPCSIHQCEEICHGASCPPCRAIVTQKCRCNSTTRTVECHETSSENEQFVCAKPCGLKKNCGRHRCNERCCSVSNNGCDNCLASGEDDPHLCRLICGKKLRCGQHYCEALCHSGHCPPCLEMIFSDLTCACGRTSIPPPLPCGTPPPSCQLPCLVPLPCGHPASHSCHFGDCPPCSVPISKECVGGHVVIRNIPCGSKDIRCNKLCGKTRGCGLHACNQTCHPSPCDDASHGGELDSRPSCGQECGAPRRDCKHTCTARCHPSSPCPNVRCSFPVKISCSCSRKTMTVPCGAGGSSSDAVFEASVVQKLSPSLLPVEQPTRTKIPLGMRKLRCDDECAAMERKRVLADAFEITPPNLESFQISESSPMADLFADLMRRDLKWVLSVEERCKFLVLGKGRGSANCSLKLHVFCPMLKEKRDAITVIAERWKLAIYAMGWDPKRFIVVHATPKSRPPPLGIGLKGADHRPPFDPLIDMDFRLVVCFLDLPKEADINSSVHKFGGERQLVWLDSKNGIAVFNDPARAAAALRKLDHASAYQGAAMAEPRKKAAPRDLGAMDGPWGSEDASWSSLKSDLAPPPSSLPLPLQESRKQREDRPNSSTLTPDVVDNWEEACAL